MKIVNLVIVFLILNISLVYSQRKISLSEKLSYTTVMVQTNKGLGTGYFFRLALDSLNYKDVIVTNKHVIKGGTTGSFYFRLKDGKGNPVPKSKEKITIKNFESKWILHPDKNVDLCILPLDSIKPELKKSGKTIYYLALEEAQIPTDKQLNTLFALQSMVMFGYPRGLWDSVNNFPIMRRGFSASNPLIDYQGRKEFALDIAAMPGSSGSPIFVLDEGGYYDNFNNMIGSDRIYFMGTLWGGPVRQNKGKGKIKTKIEGELDIEIETKLPINIGYVIKSELLISFKKMIK